MVYRRNTKELSVTFRVRPAVPVPNRVATLLFEVSQRRGDGEKPLEAAELIAQITPEGADAPMGSYVVHPLRASGLYGMHLTAPRSGVYRVQVAPRSRKPGGPALAFEVQLGIGVPTPMQGEGTAPVESSASAALGDLMESLGDMWDELLSASREPNAKPAELTPIIKRIAQIPPKIVGQGRFPEAAQREEFDQLARKLGDRVTALPAVLGDPAKAKAEMLEIENTICLRCHTKFRFEITRDVKSWPQFQPAEPSTKGQPGR